MIFLYILISILVTIIWVYYFSSINIFRDSNYKLIALAFLLGLASVPLVIFINNPISNNLLPVKVFNEELIKISFFILFYLAFKKHFKEPVDFIIYICMVALGFTVLENILKFTATWNADQNNEGLFDTYVLSRVILGPLGHISYAVIAVYGWIRYKYENNQHKLSIVFKFLLISFLLHVLYNYLVQEETQDMLDRGIDLYIFNLSSSIVEDAKHFHVEWALILACLYYLFISSVFINIINNVLNNDTNFNYKKVLNPNSISLKLLAGYGALFLLQLVIYLFIHFEAMYSPEDEISSLAGLNFIKTSFKVFLFAFTSVAILMRISRYKFLKGRWKKLKFELPFYLFKENYFIELKGDSNDEAIICSKLDDFFELHPVYFRRGYLRFTRKAFLERKIIDDNDNSYFLVKLYKNKKSEDYDYVIIKSKRFGKRETIESYPIVNVYQINGLEEIANIETNFNNFKLLDMAYVKPRVK